MAREPDRVIDYLREARKDELALVRTLRSHIARAPRGPYRKGLERYLAETRGHARRLERRLDDLGAGEGRLRSGARAVRQAMALGRAPIDVILRARPGDKLLRGAQYGCATEGLVIATYTALELVAGRAGDNVTADLARRIRVEEQHMLEWLRHEILKLTDSFIRDELDAVEHAEEERGRAGERPWAGHEEVSIADVREALSRAEREGADRV
jgi:ferritin-like metal-binding protein YciE